MSERPGKGGADESGRLEQAVQWFLRMRGEAARVEDLPELQHWIDNDPRNAVAYQKVCAAWQTVGKHASAPEVVIGRRDALENSRRAGRQRWSTQRIRLLNGENGRFGSVRYWLIAASLVIALLVGLGSWISLRTKVYTTDIGERRTLTLPDGSVITLDSLSRMRMRYTEKERLVALEQGQAQFAVAKDALRPFRVRARDRTVVALGTQFNVELVAGAVFVTLIEGHVVVTAQDPGSGEASSKSGDREGTIELTAGEALRIRQDGRAVLVPHVDLDRATAWESGKLFFDNEPLASAAERVNRYARRQIEVDSSVATVEISGVFNTGDANAFIEAVTAYFPVEAHQASDGKVYLTAR